MFVLQMLPEFKIPRGFIYSVKQCITPENFKLHLSITLQKEQLI